MLDTVFRRIRASLRIIGWIELAVVTFLLFGIVASIGAQVVSRYVFNNPLIWVEEAVVYAFIWSVFLGGSVGIKAQRHIRIEWLSPRAGPRTASYLFILRQLVVIAIVVLVLPYAYKVIGTESRSMTVSLPWQLPRFLFFSLPLSTSFVLIGTTSLFFLLEGLRALPTAGRVEAILKFRDDDYEDVEKLLVSS